MNRLFWKALLAFIALPGIVAFAVPLLLLAPNAPASFSIAGAGVAGVGIVLLLWCVVEFYVNGRGTLAPWSPPQRLVTTGLYKYSRNPMYVGVLTILAGWAAGYRSRPLSIYAVIVAIAFHLRVLSHEEPWLARTFGESWQRYKASVPRWLLFP